MTTDAERIAQTPAAQIPVSARSDFWVQRLQAMKKPFLDCGAYGQPLSVAGDVTRTIRVFPRPGYAGHFDKVPDVFHYPPGFSASAGTDNQADVIWAKGVDSVWGYRTKATSTWFEWAGFRLANLFKGMTDGDAVAGSVGHIPADLQGNAGFYGPSSPVVFGVPTADEVEAGQINRRMSWTMTLTMGGTVAPRTILDVDHPDIGVKWKAACAPGWLIENNPKATDVNRGVMMGQPFALGPAWTPARHNAWVASKPAANRQAADTFGRALTEYGWAANQSGPNDLFPLDSNQAKRYRAAGVVPGLLDGIDWSCAVALVPPTAQYVDGSTGTREGLATSISY